MTAESYLAGGRVAGQIETNQPATLPGKRRHGGRRHSTPTCAVFSERNYCVTLSHETLLERLRGIVASVTFSRGGVAGEGRGWEWLEGNEE